MAGGGGVQQILNTNVARRMKSKAFVHINGTALVLFIHICVQIRIREVTRLIGSSSPEQSSRTGKL